jgi:hypothetical protein
MAATAPALLTQMVALEKLLVAAHGATGGA